MFEADMQHLLLDPNARQPPTRDMQQLSQLPTSLPAKKSSIHPQSSTTSEDASVFFIGTATTVLEWRGIRLLTDPNFLHAGDHVHLGPGVTGTRQTNPAVDLHELPPIDVVLLSHYHADHFDQPVESSLRRDLPIVTTPHAKSHLAAKGEGEAFTAVHAVDTFESLVLDIGAASGQTAENRSLAIKVTAMPGKHVPPGPLATANDILAAVPPTNGWMLELGHHSPASDPTDNTFNSTYRIYISGDTLLVDELKEIPKRFADQKIDLMLVHLGGTTIPSPKLPMLMVTMDAKQGVELMRLIKPELTIPIHYDDYDVFLSPLSDFRKAVDDAGWGMKVVYLDRGDVYKFAVG